MDRILSEQFVSSFLIPYLKGNILGNVDKDPVLQKIFTTQDPLNDDERNSLKVNYFKNTGTILEKDFALREVFWKQFVQFVRRQRKISSDNVRLLAFRLLPDAVTHEFSTEAQQNLLKFAYQAVNALQDYRIAENIKNKELNGEISKEKAQNLKSKLGQGKLVMVKDKNGLATILEDEEVKRALANVSFQADLYSKLETTGEGEELAVYPDEIQAQEPVAGAKAAEKGMTLSNIELEIYEKQATKVEVMLEDSGMFVEGKLKPDKTGMVRGYVVDKKTRERLLVEVNTNKSNSKLRFTFVKKPAKTFLIDQQEVKKFFKDENKSADEVYDTKEKEKMENPMPFPLMAPIEPKKKSEPDEETQTEGMEAVGPVPEGQGKSGFYRRSAATATNPINIMAAKETYMRKIIRRASRGKQMLAAMPQATAPGQENYEPTEQQQAPKGANSGSMRMPIINSPAATAKKTLSPARITGIAAAAGIGTPMILSLFT